MRKFGECESATAKVCVALQERQSRICFRNPRRQKLRLVRIDGCAITEGPRCDWLLVDRSSIEHYVELKGSDVAYALMQIQNTIQQVSEDPRSCRKKAFVISLRCPLTSTEIQRRQIEFKADYNAVLLVKRTNYEVNL